MTSTAIRSSGIASLLDRFDAFVLDQWGVLHEGNTVYDGVPEALALLRSAGKRTLLLTNSSKTVVRNVDRLTTRYGISPNSYDVLVSSAQLLRDHLAGERLADFEELVPRRVFTVADEGDEVLLADTHVQCVASPVEADAVVLLSIEPGYMRKHAKAWVDEALTRGLPLLCPSADVHSVRADGVVSGMAEIIADYARAGGTVVNFGKPERYVYEHCARLLRGVEPSRILAVGDQIGSDVLGARLAGWSTALVETGAGRLSANHPDLRHISPDFVMPALRP